MIEQSFTEKNGQIKSINLLINQELELIIVTIFFITVSLGFLMRLLLLITSCDLLSACQILISYFSFLFTLQFKAARLQFLHEFSSSSLSLYSSLVLFWALFFTWNSLLHLGFLLHIWLPSLLGLSFFFYFLFT